MLSTKKKEPSERQFRDGSHGSVDFSPTVPNFNKKIPFGQSLDTYSEPEEFSSKFTPKMLSKSLLSASYYRLGSGRSKFLSHLNDGFEPINPNLNRFGFSSRSFRVFECGQNLTFAYGIFDTGEIDSHGRLIHANFCRDRLCPMCNWRRTMKIFNQVSRIMDYIGSQYRFLFLTLTVPNCPPEFLNDTLDSVNLGFHHLKRTKRFKSSILGFHKSLEVTINPITGFYHPHIHLVLAVSKSYFHSKLYISHGEWLNLWRSSMHDDSITQVFIETIKPKVLEDGSESLHSAVSEVSKYSVKASDFLGKFDKDGYLIEPFPDEVIDSRVYYLSTALCGRQLSVFGGVFYDIQKILNLDDSEDGDLVHLNDDSLNPYIADLVIRYNWRTGIGKYKAISSDIVLRGD